MKEIFINNYLKLKNRMHSKIMKQLVPKIKFIIIIDWRRWWIIANIIKRDRILIDNRVS